MQDHSLSDDDWNMALGFEFVRICWHYEVHVGIVWSRGIVFAKGRTFLGHSSGGEYVMLLPIARKPFKLFSLKYRNKALTFWVKSFSVARAYAAPSAPMLEA